MCMYVYIYIYICINIYIYTHTYTYMFCSSTSPCAGHCAQRRTSYACERRANHSRVPRCDTIHYICMYIYICIYIYASIYV